MHYRKERNMAIFSENDIKNKLFHINNFFNFKQINEKECSTVI